MKVLKTNIGLLTFLVISASLAFYWNDQNFNSSSFMESSNLTYVQRLDDVSDREVASYKRQLPSKSKEIDEKRAKIRLNYAENNRLISGSWQVYRILDIDKNNRTIRDEQRMNDLVELSLVNKLPDYFSSEVELVKKQLFKEGAKSIYHISWFPPENKNVLAVFRSLKNGGVRIVELRKINMKEVVANRAAVDGELAEDSDDVEEGIDVVVKTVRNLSSKFVNVKPEEISGQAKIVLKGGKIARLQNLKIDIVNQQIAESFEMSDVEVTESGAIGALAYLQGVEQEVSGMISKNGSNQSFTLRFGTGALAGAVIDIATEFNVVEETELEKEYLAEQTGFQFNNNNLQTL